MNRESDFAAGRARRRTVRVPREPRRTPFDRFAETASEFVSKGLFFTICIAVVVIWMPTIAMLVFVWTWL